MKFFDLGLLTRVSLLIALAMVTTHCGKDEKKDSSAPAIIAPTGYIYQNGQCIQTSNGQAVAMTYCNTTLNNGYSMNQYGQCIQTSTGQPVAQNLCTTTNTGYTLNQYGQCIQTSTGQPVAQNLCTTTNTGYTLNQYGQCIQTSTGQPVAQNLCTTTNTGYTIQNGQCVQISTGQIVNIQLCSTTGTGSAQCFGSYFWMGYGYPTPVTCQGWNCSGYTLVSAQTGQTQLCQ